MSDAQPTLKQLRYFVALAHGGQYRRAAEQLDLSQPSLSQQIAALESVLGLKLVERGRRGVILTPAGREVLAQAQSILDGVERLMGSTQTLQEGISGTLRLGSTSTIGPYVLPRFLRHLHAEHPDLKLVVRDGPPRDLLDELASGVHDVVISEVPVRAEDFQSVPLYREPLLLAVARDHRLAGQALVTVEDLADEDLLALGSAYALRAQVARLGAASGARLRDDYEGTSLDALRQMVSMNMGVTLLPSLYIRSEVPGDGGDVAVVPVKGGLYRTVGLIWRRTTGKPALLERFREIAETVISEVFKDRVQPMRR
ncbi:hydrogen peroxide-inducible genes activator [Shimia sp. SDUM112013]|uniref:hydrogen peroxide-inducible genes activator n=1 Tax=Shimia sp. SDUM112013 TaxID=3136160 RepID=UPI0032EFF87A